MLDTMLSTMMTSALLLSSLIPVNAKPLHQFKPRAAVDVCANVDANLEILDRSFGKVEICLCLSAIPGILLSGGIYAEAVAAVGAQSVTKSLNSLVSQAGQQCQYPDNCTPVCQSSNPCGFECNDGFVPYPASKPTTCACLAPYKVCNGQCGLFNTCGSQPAAPYSKRELEFRDMECQPGWKLCKIPGRGVLECVDVMNDLWSCGGCELSSFDNERVGTDCSVIPNVAGVSCLAGACKVESCKRGFQLNEDETSCVSRNTIIAESIPSEYPMFVQNGKGSFKL